jgi:DnaJ-class molecular chaperone
VSRPFNMNYKTYEGPRGTPREWRGEFRFRLGLDTARKTVGKKSPYEILGVALSASWAEIKSAYRKLALIHHPDRGGNAIAFREIQGAYELLEHKFGKD